jgi:hypothetical protein
MQRFAAILLLLIFAATPAAPLLAAVSNSKSALPACCRRDGQHHCMAGMMGQDQPLNDGATFRAQRQSCPYCPADLSVSHHFDSGLAPAQAVFAALVSHPAVHAQTQSKRRIASDRSRNKRGPPPAILL